MTRYPSTPLGPFTLAKTKIQQTWVFCCTVYTARKTHNIRGFWHEKRMREKTRISYLCFGKWCACATSLYLWPYTCSAHYVAGRGRVYCVCIMLVNVYIENCTISCSHFTIIASVITLSYQFLTLALTFLLWPLSCLITPHKHPIFHLFISFPLPPSPSSHMTVNILMIM